VPNPFKGVPEPHEGAGRASSTAITQGNGIQGESQ
jgi:hypothetical protein